MAELRRLYSQAPWYLTGVVVNGTWAPADAGIDPVDVRTIEAGLVTVRELPPFIAPDDRAALVVALDVAKLTGRALGPATGPYAVGRHWPGTDEFTIPDIETVLARHRPPVERLATGQGQEGKLWWLRGVGPSISSGSMTGGDGHRGFSRP